MFPDSPATVACGRTYLPMALGNAQLSFGNGMIMRGSVMPDETEFGRLMKQSDQVNGGNSQCVCRMGETHRG